jgi:ABC-type dipeptide/oligopeptide/nickel transport system permease component
MPGRMPFTLNTMIMMPLLRSLPASSIVSVVIVFVSMTGLDFGVLGLGHPETAADRLVALIMAFSVTAPAFWGVYIAVNVWKWLSGLPLFNRQNPDQS